MGGGGLVLYGRRSLRSFADAISRLTGRRFEILFDGGMPRTDGKRVFLPEKTVHSLKEFQALCGIALHEVAHAWFGTPGRMKGMLRAYSEPDRPLAKECLNAVLDVADEVRLEGGFARGVELFARAREFCVGRRLPPPAKPPSATELLAAGILLARSEPRDPVRRALYGWGSRPGIRRIVRLLSRTPEPVGPCGFTPDRSEAEWARLERLGRRLFGIVSQYANEVGQPEPVQTAARKALVARGRRRARRHAGSASSWDQLPDHLRRGCPPFDESLLQAVRPTFRRIAQSFPAEPEREVCRGLISGPKLGNLPRYGTDGKIFARWEYQDVGRSAVALLIDQSSSMIVHLGTFLPYAVALAESLDETEGVELGLFRFGTRVEQVGEPRELRKIELLGQTFTHLALRAARDWLTKRDVELRTTILITDGCPTDGAAATEEMCALLRRGSGLLVGADASSRADCERTFPRGHFFEFDPANPASGLSVALRKLPRM